jgi:3-oxoacyl-[acyl-carrier protein] reductase
VPDGAAAPQGSGGDQLRAGTKCGAYRQIAAASGVTMRKNKPDAMRNVLVTGGSRGLGLAIAQKLAAGGYRVIALARHKSKDVTAAVAEADRTGAGALHFIPFDLGMIDKIPELVRSLRKEFGPLFGLVNNAALGYHGALATMHNSKLEEQVRVNTLSPIVLTKYVVRGMMADGAGRIVNIASIIGVTGYSGLAAYAATKSSMIGMTRSLAREVGRFGINVNAVAPGFMATDMTQFFDGETLKKIMRRTALRRFAEVEDVANAVEFLLGDKARNIAGTVLTVDAGATA